MSKISFNKNVITSLSIFVDKKLRTLIVEKIQDSQPRLDIIRRQLYPTAMHTSTAR